MRPFSRLLAPALAAGLLLTACGGGDATGSDLPTVKGSYGAKPAVSIDKGTDASGKLESEVLSRGDGPKVKKGDLLVADYLGKNYRSGKVFDNSYDRGAPASFTLKSGPGGVISGWVKTLAGVPAGSRVLLVAPPKDGYGKTGNDQAGIKGSDSLVFVVDLIAAYSNTSALPQSTPVTDVPEGTPTVTGTDDPKVTVPSGATPPKQPVTTVLSTGTGEKVAQGQLVIVQYTAVSWENRPLASSWSETGPQGVPVGGAQPSPFDLLVGQPAGSRVMLSLPAQTGSDASKDSVAVVVDILGVHSPAKEATK